MDEAVLKLGQWEMPDAERAFYPPRDHRIATLAGLSKLMAEVTRESLQQKGYVVGDGGDLENTALRKEFKTLAFWKAGAQTDAQGRIHVEFPAPDSLTEYRLVAIGGSAASQFGGGSSTFKISKPLLCEPALPRFARYGDEVILRAVVRQTAVPTGKITVKCEGDGVELQDATPQTQEAPNGEPRVAMRPPTC